MSWKDNIVCMTVQNCKSSFWANSKIDGHGLLKMINNQKSYLIEQCDFLKIVSIIIFALQFALWL